jgi:hypothetical protein
MLNALSAAARSRAMKTAAGFLSLLLPMAVDAADSTVTVEAEATMARPHGVFRPFAGVMDTSGTGTKTDAHADLPFSFAPAISASWKSPLGRARLSAWWFRHDTTASISSSAPNLFAYTYIPQFSSSAGSASAHSRLRASSVDLTTGIGPSGREGLALIPRVGLRYLDLTTEQRVIYVVGTTAMERDEARTWGIGPVAEIAARYPLGDGRFAVDGHFGASLLRSELSTDRSIVAGSTRVSASERSTRMSTMSAIGVSLHWRAWRGLSASLGYEFSRWSDVLDGTDYIGPAGVSRGPRDITWDIASLGVGYAF